MVMFNSNLGLNLSLNLDSSLNINCKNYSIIKGY